MGDYLLTEVEVSDDKIQDKEAIQPMSKEDLEFIDDDCDQDEVDFYRSVDKTIFVENKGEIPVPVLKHSVGKLNIESDSESEYDEEEEQFAVPNSKEIDFPEDNAIIIPEATRPSYGSDNYEWNHYKRSTCEVFEFPKNEKFMQTFLHSLLMAINNNKKINPFLPMSKNYVGVNDFKYPIWVIL